MKAITRLGQGRGQECYPFNYRQSLIYSLSLTILPQLPRCSKRLGSLDLQPWTFCLENFPRAPPFNVGDTNAINGHKFYPNIEQGRRGDFFRNILSNEAVFGYTPKKDTKPCIYAVIKHGGHLRTPRKFAPPPPIMSPFGPTCFNAFLSLYFATGPSQKRLQLQMGDCNAQGKHND